MHLFYRFVGPKRHKGHAGRQAIFQVELRPTQAVEGKGVHKIFFDRPMPDEERRLRTIKPVGTIRGTLATLPQKIVSALHQRSVESKAVKFHVANDTKILDEHIDQIRTITKAVQSALKEKNEEGVFGEYELGALISEPELFTAHIEPSDRVAYMGANTEMFMDSALSYVGTILAQNGMKKSDRLTLVDRDHSIMWPGMDEQISAYAKRAFRRLGKPRASGDPIFHRMSQRQFLRENPDVRIVLPKIKIADVKEQPLAPGSQDKIIDHGSSWFITGGELVDSEQFVRNAQQLAGIYDQALRPGGKALITVKEYGTHDERGQLMIRRMLEALAAKSYRIIVHPIRPGRYQLGKHELSRFHDWGIVAIKPVTRAEQLAERLRARRKS